MSDVRVWRVAYVKDQYVHIDRFLVHLLQSCTMHASLKSVSIFPADFVTELTVWEVVQQTKPDNELRAYLTIGLQKTAQLIAEAEVSIQAFATGNF